MYMDIAAFSKLYKSAAPFVADYEEKQIKLQVMLTYAREECKDSNEKELVLTWVQNTADWLTSNEEKYNKLKAISSIPTEDIDELHKSYKAIYGEGIQ